MPTPLRYVQRLRLDGATGEENVVTLTLQRKEAAGQAAADGCAKLPPCYLSLYCCMPLQAQSSTDCVTAVLIDRVIIAM